MKSFSIHSTCLALALAAALAGCSTTGPSPRPRSSSSGSSGNSPLAELHLFSAPTAINLDPEPGLDGFETRLYASSAARARGAVIAKENLEILMYDGVPSAEALSTATPLHVWTFTPSDLRRLATQTSLGTGYRLALKWGVDRPKESSFTVIARLRSLRGGVVTSSPSVIAMSLK